jgi:hypothetical protein
MAGTDPIVDEYVANPDLERRKEIQRLRSLFIRPNHVFLVTQYVDGNDEDRVERWLSDSYVIVKVTGSSALEMPDVSAEGTPVFTVAEDGAYNLMASKGLTPVTKDVLIPDTAGLLDALASRPTPLKWLPMERTSWSMADSEAKLMLAWAHGDGGQFHLAINEGVWQAFADAYPGCPVTFEFYDDETPYRVSCDCGVIGYVAHADFPEDMNMQAFVLVDWLVSHHESQ